MGKKLEQLRKSLKILGSEWLEETRDAVSGRILRIRTETLFKSLDLVDRTNENPPVIELTADAKSPEGFPYAAYHEFGPSRSYIRPSLLFVLSKMYRSKSGLGRALVGDSAEGIIEDLLERGWFPGRLPNSAFRIVRMDMSGGLATTGVPKRGGSLGALTRAAARSVR